MSLDRLTTITFILTYGYGITTILAHADYTTIHSALTVLARVLVLSIAYVGVTWFLIWLDHTYYPHRQHQGDDA